MEQPTPIVSQADVERIVRRDYPQDKYANIISVLDGYGVSEWHRETNRVRLAVLKLANGNIQDLRRFIEWAKSDYRDVLSPAEYPLASKKWSKMRNMSKDEVEAIYKKDWEQYQQWLNRA